MSAHHADRRVLIGDIQLQRHGLPVSNGRGNFVRPPGDGVGHGDAFDVVLSNEIVDGAVAHAAGA